MEQSIYFQKSVFSDLQTSRIGDDEYFETPRVRDVHFLLNEQALQNLNLDPSALKPYLDSLSTSSPQNVQISDDDLFALASSRYVQQPSDVSSFAEHLESSAKEIIDKFKHDDERKKAWSAYLESIKSSVRKSESEDD